MSDEKPNPHNITLIQSSVWRCSSCHTWFIRAPVVVGLGGMGEQCEKCGCSSFVSSRGRPFGPTSKSWDWALHLVNEIFEGLYHEEKVEYLRFAVAGTKDNDDEGDGE